MNTEGQQSDDGPIDDPHIADLSQYRQMYVDETDEQLDDLVETMLILEEDPTDSLSLATAFRLLHSMKGAAGMMGFDQITALTHHLETRFERLRSGRIQLDRVTMNLTLRCIDFLRQCNERLRADQALATPDVLLEELRNLEEKTEQELDAEVQAAQVSPIAQPISEMAGETPATVETSTTEALEVHHHLVLAFDNEITVQSEAIRRLLNVLDELGRIEAMRPELDSVDADNPISDLDIIILTALSPGQLANVIMVEGVQRVDVRVPMDSEAPPLVSLKRQTTESETTIDVTAEAQATVEAQVSTKSLSTSDSQVAVPVDSSDSSRDQSRPAASSKANETMRVDIGRLDDLMSLAGELVVNRAQFVQVAKDLGGNLKRSTFSQRSRDFQDSLRRTIDRLRQLNDSRSAGDDWSSSISELESGLDFVQRQQMLLEESRRGFGRLDEAIDQLSRISNSLQRGVLGTRMVPVAPLFSRFKRVVRDLAIDRGKKVALVIEGDNTELDKRMIDALGDPLVHLVRNSIDHGLESPEVRRAAGKLLEGRITLSAQHRGNHVYIILEDDGGGIDDAKIRRRLVNLQWLDQAAADALSRREAIEFIWHPSFSTADKVTDVSGRGVGMDIVKAKIGELAGSVEVESEVGIGTKFILKLPLTLAIISSLMIKIRNIVFAIPKEDVREIVMLQKTDVISVQGKDCFEIRGHYVPLIAIEQIFSWSVPYADFTRAGNSETKQLPQTAKTVEVVVLQAGGRTIGLKVDRSLGSQDVVIKSLAEHFISIEGLAGASIMGDGAVALMLDVASLLRMTFMDGARGTASAGTKW